MSNNICQSVLGGTWVGELTVREKWSSQTPVTAVEVVTSQVSGCLVLICQLLLGLFTFGAIVRVLQLLCR